MGNLAALVIATEDGDALLVADLQGDEEGDGFDRVIPTIHVVAHEEVVGVRTAAANLEQLLEIVELAVDVTAHGHGALHRLHVRLLLQNLTRLAG